MNLVRTAVLFFTIILFPAVSFAVILNGRVTDAGGNSLPFVNVFVKGTTKGTTTNKDGYYAFDLQPGTYEINYKMVGYKVETKTVVIGNEKQTINVTLSDEVYTTKDVVINADGEDPAYRVIRA